MAWYPIKDRKAGDTLARTAIGTPFAKALKAEFLVRPRDDATLAGGGLIICNTPWKLDEKLAALGEELAGILGDGQANWAVDWLTAG